MNRENKSKNNGAMMQMSPWDFDQSPDGWRKFNVIGKRIAAAKLIRDYIAKNKDRIADRQEGEKTVKLEIMYFHIGQLLAMEGQEHWPEAIEAFSRSFLENGECWNAYVSATIGFLESDAGKIDDAIETIKTSREENRKSGNIDIVLNFKKALEMGETDYERVYCSPR